MSAICGCGPATGRWVIDAIEEDQAVLVSDERTVRPRANELPGGAREGDVLIDGRVDPRATELARQAVRAQREALRRGDDGRDFSLDEPPARPEPSAKGRR